MELVQITIRDVNQSDAAPIAAIYGHHVLNGTASYELEAPSVPETLARINRIKSESWPFLVAEAEGQICGYAYVTQFRDRAAYRFTAEDSIYIDARRTGAGIGRKLLETLIERSSAQGFRTMVAVIGGAEPASIALHEALGFAEVGRLRRVGFKFGRWLDSVYMQRDLKDMSSGQ
jgi:phosphinothricin acetyltransferase